jgi:hypothetical protein
MASEVCVCGKRSIRELRRTPHPVYTASISLVTTGLRQEKPYSQFEDGRFKEGIATCIMTVASATTTHGMYN